MSSDCGPHSRQTKSPLKLRNLETKERSKLCSILSINQSWHALAGVMWNPYDRNELMYTAEDVSIIESQKQPVECLLEDWGTRGEQQPTLLDLLNCLKEANLLRAANYVQTELLKIEDYTDLEGNLSESLNTILEAVAHHNESPPQIGDMNKMPDGIDLTELTLYSYDILKIATQNFTEIHIENGGCKVGEGSYGTVYKATISDGAVAVKKLKDPVDRQFFTELSTLVKYKHENLLHLLGCSINGPSSCLVFEYMPNGSLQEGLACSRNSPPLPTVTRLSIALGSALGINFLHTFGDKPMVHRDIKSANILLDKNLTPKIGDFGLVRIGSSTMSSTFAVTENVFGTRMYMPIEAFSGDVSVKLDTYSFGVVLLELLTGLSPYDPNRDGIDLVTHMENFDDILEKIDPKVEWNHKTAIDLYKFAKLCLTTSKKERPALSDILSDLEKCCRLEKDHSEEVYV